MMLKGARRAVLSSLVTALFLFFPICLSAQSLSVVDKVVISDTKLDGVAWDGKNLWVVTYQSSPIQWQIARVEPGGTIEFAFTVPVDSLDDVHNFGMTNITSDGRTLWANHWNAGLVYRYNRKGKELSHFGVPSVNQLIPVGITYDGKSIWVLHWSDKTLYRLDKKGRELGSVSLGHVRPPLDMGLTWDGEHFWAGSRGANRITKISVEGEVLGYVKGPRQSGGIRDLDWDGEHLIVVYQQDDTVYKCRVED
jgi:sugar lactone lactonase YvrE